MGTTCYSLNGKLFIKMQKTCNYCLHKINVTRVSMASMLNHGAWCMDIVFNSVVKNWTNASSTPFPSHTNTTQCCCEDEVDQNKKWTHTLNMVRLCQFWKNSLNKKSYLVKTVTSQKNSLNHEHIKCFNINPVSIKLIILTYACKNSSAIIGCMI